MERTEKANRRRIAFVFLLLFFAIFTFYSILKLNPNAHFSNLRVDEHDSTPQHTSHSSEEVEEVEEENIISGVSSALQFVTDREKAYEKENKSFSWPMRGIGFLYDRHDVVLLGNLVISQTRSESNVVRIYNVKSPVACSKIDIWVRVNGPEIFAGHANVINPTSDQTANVNTHGSGKCYWEFKFDTRKPGSFTIDAKVLVWNSAAVVDSDGPVTCKQSPNSSLVDSFPINKSFIGFKVYHPEEMCCEVCSRLAGHCKAWSNPIPEFPDGKVFHRGCTLYFANSSDYAIPYSTMLATTFKNQVYKESDQPAQVTYGLPHDQPTSYFIGCGWSYWFSLDFPCISGDLDDRVYFTENEFVLATNEKENSLLSADAGTDSQSTTIMRNEPNLQSEAFCKIDSESLAEHKGRWVRKPWPTKKECPHPMEPDLEIEEFGIMKFEGNYPHCWHRDDLSEIGGMCLEPNCQFLNKTTPWKSSIHQETEWYGDWKHDSGCSYSEFTDDQLQTCVDQRKIYEFGVEGESIASFLQLYLTMRVKNIKLYNNTNSGNGTKVTLSTFGMLHSCPQPTDKLRTRFKNKRNISASPLKEEFFWVNGYFLSSERELLCTSSRMMQFNRIGEEILQSKGYSMINAFDMSAAFTFDTATQNDGMHIIGPVMKMIITKLFHYLCAGDQHDTMGQ